MTSDWPPSRAGSSVRASTSATPVFTRMRRSNASHAGSGSAGDAAPLHGVAVGIPRVAVGAAELAADVRIDRPEAHAGSLAAVLSTERTGSSRNRVPRCALVEHRPPVLGRPDAGSRSSCRELTRSAPSRSGGSSRSPTPGRAGRRTRGRRGAWRGGNVVRRRRRGAGHGRHGRPRLRYLFGTPLHRCRAARRSVKTASTFAAMTDQDAWYEGAGGTRLFCRHCAPETAPAGRAHRAARAGRSLGPLSHGRRGPRRRAASRCRCRISGATAARPGQRGHIDAWGDLREDLRRLVQRTRAEPPGVPLFLLGNSLGGLVVARLRAAPSRRAPRRHRARAAARRARRARAAAGAGAGPVPASGRASRSRPAWT